MSVYFIRHPKPDIPDGLCYGRSDPPLLEKPARLAAKLVADLKRPDHLYSSPLQRCHSLAEALARHWGHVIKIDPRLQEIDFGAWEGKPWDDIPRHEIDAWAADFMGARPHGGESVAAFHKRVMKAMEAIHDHGGDAVIVTHAGVIRAAHARAATPDGFALDIGYGDVLQHDDTQGLCPRGS